MNKEQIVAALSALAQETRLDIFRYLVQTGPEGVPAGHIADHLGLPAATLSFHLKTLKHAGLIDFRRDGRSLIYRANFANMNTLLAYLTENCFSDQIEVPFYSSKEVSGLSMAK
jgi:DNA-binding transcriptional ArsR family regulator